MFAGKKKIQCSDNNCPIAGLIYQSECIFLTCRFNFHDTKMGAGISTSMGDDGLLDSLLCLSSLFFLPAAQVF